MNGFVWNVNITVKNRKKKEKNLLDKRARFDVVSIIDSCNGKKSELIKNAFELDERFTC